MLCRRRDEIELIWTSFICVKQEFSIKLAEWRINCIGKLVFIILVNSSRFSELSSKYLKCREVDNISFLLLNIRRTR